MLTSAKNIFPDVKKIFFQPSVAYGDFDAGACFAGEGGRRPGGRKTEGARAGCVRAPEPRKRHEMKGAPKRAPLKQAACGKPHSRFYMVLPEAARCILISTLSVRPS